MKPSLSFLDNRLLNYERKQFNPKFPPSHIAVGPYHPPKVILSFFPFVRRQKEGGKVGKTRRTVSLEGKKRPSPFINFIIFLLIIFFLNLKPSSSHFPHHSDQKSLFKKCIRLIAQKLEKRVYPTKTTAFRWTPC